jgi:hydrogenase maturation protein HypF
MRGFTMCDACRVEYDDPLDRRFHAQPIACPHCGPQVALWDESGKTIATRNDAILLAAEKIKAGAIIALKGIGGFQLLVDATSEEAVLRLRRRKQREEKPFAVMYPSLSDAERDCEIGDLERRLLRSGQSPIVLVHQKPATRLAPSVAPRNPDCGVLIPYSPLHHLLLQELASPVVATSGNLSEDPICIDEGQALTTLKEIADFYLVHDRPIQRHVDDSVVRIVAGREMVLRRARGYAPLPVALDGADAPILAVGAHQKSSIALSVGPMAIVSQHIGDLNTLATWNVFKAVTEDLSRMYQHKPVAIACDLHPDYRSGTFRTGIDLDIIPVQHHYAHVLSCMADNHVTGDVLGIAWDGTGYGTDSTIWGGEFLKVGVSGFERFSSLFPFRLPGGEASIHEPRRTALGILFATYGTDAIKMSHLPPVASFSANEIKTIETMICHGTNTPITSSMGRLFDGIAAILGIRQHVRHEGQAAMDLENLARKSGDDIVYEMPLKLHDGKLTVDWRPMLAELIEDLRRELAVENIARRFHNTLAHMAVTVANAAQIEQVALSGGCFQNRLLTETCIDRLRSEGYTPYWHQRVPPNDGGISLGQLVAATRQRADKRVESERLCV